MKPFKLLLGLLSCALLVSGYAKPYLDIQTWHTKNGANVLFVKESLLPMVDIRISFWAGASRDGKQPGLAELSNTMLSAGTSKMDANQIAEKIEALGVNLGLSAGQDTATVAMRSLTDKKLLDPASSILQQLLVDSTFRDQPFERERNRVLSLLKQQEQFPDEVAYKRFMRSIYPKHPYGQPSSGTLESVSKINSKDAKAFYKKYYVAKNATVSIVGDLSLQQAKQLANKVMLKLPAGKKAEPIPAVSPVEKAQNVNIDFPSTQTQIRIGAVGIAKKDPDYFSLYVGNYTLGGGSLVSRLFDEVREKRGLSYGVSSRFTTKFRRGPFVINLQTRNDQTKEAIDVSLNTLKTFLSKGPTDDELTAAKNNIIGSQALRISSNRAISMALLTIGVYDLPLDYLDTYEGNIEKVTKQDIVAAFKKHVNPDTLTIVTVGEKSS